jgi:hypothetical protein
MPGQWQQARQWMVAGSWQLLAMTVDGGNSNGEGKGKGKGNGNREGYSKRQGAGVAQSWGNESWEV